MGWQSLGAFWISGTTLTVKLQNNDGNYLDADAVRVVQVTPTLFSYDANGNVVSTTNALNLSTDTVYDNLNRKIETIQPDPATGQTLANDANCPKTYAAYDAADNMVATIDPNGNVTSCVYNVQGRQTETIDALGDVTTTVYDAVGNAIWVTSPAPSGGGQGRADLPSPSGGGAGGEGGTGSSVVTTFYAYDSMNRKIQETLPLPDGTGKLLPQTTWTYDANGNLVSTTDALNNTTTTRYNGWNLPTQVTDALNETTVTTYDELGQVSKVTDPLDRTTQYVYDNLGRKTETIAPDPGTGSPITSYSYDADGNMTSVSDPLLHTTQYAYDPLDRLVQTTDALRHTSTTQYDALGDVIATTDAAGRTTNYTFDDLGRKVGEQDPAPGNGNNSRPQTTWTYDLNGNVLSTTDPDGHTTWTVYDALNRAVKTVSADGSGPNDTHYAATTTYDAAGNTSSVTDPDGNVTSYSYDRLNQQVETIDPLRNTSFGVYDLDGNVVQTTDADGHVVQYVYNALNERVTENWLSSAGVPASAGSGKAWISNGTVSHTICTYYDADGETVGVTESDTTNPGNGANYEYGYDADGRLKSVRMAPADISRTPTTAHPYVSMALTEIDYTYYADGTVASASDSSDLSTVNTNTATTVYVHDALGRVTAIVQSGTGGVSEKRVYFAYNDDSQVTSFTTYPGSSTTEVTYCPFVYDGDGRLTGLSYFTSTGAAQTTGGATISYGVSYDAASNITQVVSADGTDNYGVDNADQLTSATPVSGSTGLVAEGHTYDQNGNRTDGSYQTGADNRLLCDGAFTYQYDAEGNRIKRTSLSDGSVTLYFWDSREPARGAGFRVVYGRAGADRRVRVRLFRQSDCGLHLFRRDAFVRRRAERRRLAAAGVHRVRRREHLSGDHEGRDLRAVRFPPVVYGPGGEPGFRRADVRPHGDERGRSVGPGGLSRDGPRHGELQRGGGHRRAHRVRQFRQSERRHAGLGGHGHRS